MMINGLLTLATHQDLKSELLNKNLISLKNLNALLAYKHFRDHKCLNRNHWEALSKHGLHKSDVRNDRHLREMLLELVFEIKKDMYQNEELLNYIQKHRRLYRRRKRVVYFE